jgi:hypothetical protein
LDLRCSTTPSNPLQRGVAAPSQAGQISGDYYLRTDFGVEVVPLGDSENAGDQPRRSSSFFALDICLLG